ncbi:DUF262 domain-containing protein [Streptomyces sp. NPDC047081]|uniref:DUF262 domain-containing protein n=1 Tax=Streptomyces sp. NPDC047081 TaxID=3154706 RepID=UPI0033F71BD0
MAGHEDEADPRGLLFDRPVEVGANGRPTGVELELPPDEPVGVEEFLSPADIGIETQTVRLGDLLERLDDRGLDLAPDFHRRTGMWSDVQQSRFVESLLLGIPHPPLYVAQHADDTWSVVVGQQELTAFTRFLGMAPDGLTMLRLTGLEYLPRYEGLIATELPGRLRLRLFETQAVVHVVRHTTPDDVKFNVFCRVSASGPHLTAQEIRHAMIPSGVRELLAGLAEQPSFGEATGFSVSNERMADRELVLRYLAFRMYPPADYQGSHFEQFLTAAMSRLGALPEDEIVQMLVGFFRAMETAQALFGQQAFRRSLGHRRKLPVNKALFEAIAVNLAALDDDERARLVTSRDEVRDGLYKLLTTDFAFERALTVSPGDPAHVRMRFEVVARLFRGVLSGD